MPVIEWVERPRAPAAPSPSSFLFCTMLGPASFATVLWGPTVTATIRTEICIRSSAPVRAEIVPADGNGAAIPKFTSPAPAAAGSGLSAKAYPRVWVRR